MALLKPQRPTRRSPTVSPASRREGPGPVAQLSSPATGVLEMRQALGNQAMQRLLRSGAIQAKLTVSQPDDPAEQEADRIAEEVMRMPEHSTPDTVPVPRPAHDEPIQRLCDECEEELHRQPKEEEEEEQTLQAKAAPSHTPEVSPTVEAGVSALRDGGQPLPASIRAFFEPRFGQDFSQVRIHTDAPAAESARAVNARAYTVGRDVVLGAGQYAPQTSAGRRLLGHELVHTIQQTGSGLGGGGQRVHLQRTIGDGHDLTSPRFAGDLVLEACFDNERLLRLGDRGPAVKKVQQALVDFGFPLPKFGVDGIFGSETRAAVQQFQMALVLTVDGIVGPETIGRLDTLPDPLPICPVGVEPVSVATFAVGTEKQATPNFSPAAGGCTPRQCTPPVDPTTPAGTVKIKPIIGKGSKWDTDTKFRDFIRPRIERAQAAWMTLAGIDVLEEAIKVESGIPLELAVDDLPALAKKFGASRSKGGIVIPIIFTDRCCKIVEFGGVTAKACPDAITRRKGKVPPGTCMGAFVLLPARKGPVDEFKSLLAHELGHVFLEFDLHERETPDLMQGEGEFPSVLSEKCRCRAQWYVVDPDKSPQTANEKCEGCAGPCRDPEE